MEGWWNLYKTTIEANASGSSSNWIEMPSNFTVWRSKCERALMELICLNRFRAGRFPARTCGLYRALSHLLPELLKIRILIGDLF